MRRILCALLAVFSLLLNLTAVGQDAALYFPPTDGPWQTIDPGKADWDTAKLKQALEYAGNNKSSGVVILYRGRILAEQYWPLSPPAKKPNGRANPYFHMRLGKDADGRAIEDVASVQKSVTAMLVGIAQHKSLLKIDDPVHKHLGKGWSKAESAAEEKIAIRHLITMTSGLNSRLEYEVPAGSKWYYNTAAYARALTCVSKAAKMEPNEVTKQWLTGPVGMKNSRWAVRPWLAQRPDVNKFGFATTARDLARFGLLMLAHGSWNEKQVIGDKDYIKAATSPSQKINPSYGLLWWLNIAPRRAGKTSGRMIFAAPRDMYAAKGALVRRLYVLPSRQLVITRLGDQPAQGFDAEFFRRLRSAIEK